MNKKQFVISLKILPPKSRENVIDGFLTIRVGFK